MGSWGWNSIWLETLSFWAARERLVSASFGKLRVVSTSTWRVLTQVSWFLDVSHCVREGVTFCLMRFQILSLIIKDMAVVGGSRQNELLLPLGG